MSAPRPKIVLLSLAKMYLESFEHTFQALRDKADVEEITDPAEATVLLSGSSRPVVFATDAALTIPACSQQRAAAVSFVRNGGTIIFGAQFCQFAFRPNIDELFAAFSLPWKLGDYRRMEMDLKPHYLHQLRCTGLAIRYDLDAKNLAHVATSDAPYGPSRFPRTPNSIAEAVAAHVYEPEPVRDLTQVPVAFGNCGEGKVGYIGDMHCQNETTGVLLAMCGLNG